MDAEHFRQLLNGRAPFASIYFEDTHDTADAADQLRLKWREVHEQLVQHGVDDSVIADIESAILDLRPPIGRSGRAVIADAAGVILNEHLLQPGPLLVRVSQLPYIIPVVENGFVERDYVLAEVDHTGADVTLCVDGALHSEIVDGEGYPVHKAASAETAGYGDPQLRTDEAARKNVRAVAERLAELVDNTGADTVFVVGEVQSRSELLAALPKRLSDQTVVLPVGARHSGHDFTEVKQAVEAAIVAELRDRQLAELEDAVQRFTAEAGRQSGLAAEGLSAVCSALSQGAVETLIIGAIGDATVVADEELAVAAPNPDKLSEYGAAPAHTLRADEALPMGALAIGAAIVGAGDRIDPVDGIAAVLRYAS